MISLEKLCHLAKLSRSGFSSWRDRPIKDPTEDELLVIELFLKSKQIKGARRLKMSFERIKKRSINLKKIKRIKKEFGLVTRIRKKSKFRMIFKNGEEHQVSPNLVKRRFKSKTKIVLSTDMTELRYSYGQKAYLAAAKDLRTKEIVSFHVGHHPTIEVAMAGLPEVLERISLKRRKKIIVHSDQGGQYTSQQFRSPLEKLGINLSMSRKGNCLDNAPIESFFGHFKDESGFKECKDFKELTNCVESYMYYYNYQRPQWDLKKKTPAEAGGKKSLVL